MSSPDSFMSNSTTPGPDPLLVDRTQWPDYLIVAITGLCSLLLFVGGIILIFIRNYEPIKNKQIHIILPSTFSGVIFMLSSLVRCCFYCCQKTFITNPSLQLTK